jgi:Fe-S oxidoreductase
MDQLLQYQFDKIFPGCRLLDIHEYLAEKGVKLDGVEGVRYMYHDPCHTPMKQGSPLATAKSLLGTDVKLSERCCGEAGTFAATRPDIATQVKFRKSEEVKRVADSLRADGASAKVKLLTACPSCLQGLSRYENEAGVEADYIVVELARRLLGEGWLERYLTRVQQGGVEKVLL